MKYDIRVTSEKAQNVSNCCSRRYQKTCMSL